MEPNFASEFSSSGFLDALKETGERAVQEGKILYKEKLCPGKILAGKVFDEHPVKYGYAHVKVETVSGKVLYEGIPFRKKLRALGVSYREVKEFSEEGSTYTVVVADH